MGTWVHLGEMLSRNARMYPNAVALVQRAGGETEKRKITWKEFDEAANRLANALTERGLKKGDKVIHLMLDSIDWLIAYFGIIRTGAWVVPLNFRFTSREIQYCVDVAEPQAMIFGAEFSAQVNAVKDRMPTIRHYCCLGKEVPAYAEPLDKVLGESSANPLNIGIEYDDPCGLYFTSGTTGQPKPILITHMNLASAAITENAHHRQAKEDIHFPLALLFHTGVMIHWLGCLIVGASAVVFQIFKGYSPELLLQIISEEKASVVIFPVPWVLDLVSKFDSQELRPDQYDLSHWRLLHTGAQPVPPSPVRKWKQYFPEMGYDTNYGLTEATGPGCVHLGLENEHKIGSIGLPGFNWESRIVDAHGNPVAQGEVGELVVRGNGVMKQYYKNPEETAATIKDGWLCTGDMARQDEDGFIYLVDRKKDIIIVGGENIYPVEIEDFFHAHEKVGDAAAFGYPDERLGETVAVVVESAPGKTLSEDEMFKFCEGLKGYQKPRRIFLGEIPRSPTGKILKRELRKKFIE